jgi:pimeloyl-ACP methyl ester carboxylesterase
MTSDLCQQAAEQTGDAWRALLVDLRNHGRSARSAAQPPPHDLRCAARDVVRLAAAALGGRPPEALIGHSMGGKTALEVVRQLALPGAPLGQPRQVWVLDARPTAMHAPLDAATREVLHVLDTVRSIPLPLPSREALYSLLRERGFSTGGHRRAAAALPSVTHHRPASSTLQHTFPQHTLRPSLRQPSLAAGMQQWLGSNLLAEGKGRYEWAFNLEGAAAMFADYLKQDYSALLR